MAESMTSGTLPARETSAVGGRVLGYAIGDLVVMAVGVSLLMFLGWAWNSAFAAWLVPVFLIRFFRSQARWYAPLIALPPMMGIFYNGIQTSRLTSLIGLQGWTTGFEAFYNFVVTPAAQFTLDLQLMEPVGSGLDTAVILGLRAHLQF